jgi:hypothetical protein
MMNRMRWIGVTVAISLSTQAFGQPVSGPGGDWSGSYAYVQGETALQPPHILWSPR